MRVAQNLILLPVFAQVLLTVAVLIAMAFARQKSLADKRATVEDAALVGDDFWSPYARACSNNYKNQFELPVLFYAVCAFALMTRMVDVAFLTLAVVFVLSRVAHTVVHLTTNIVMWRGTTFLIGLVALVAMWGMLAVRVVRAGF